MTNQTANAILSSAAGTLHTLVEEPTNPGAKQMIERALNLLNLPGLEVALAGGADSAMYRALLLKAWRDDSLRGARLDQVWGEAYDSLHPADLAEDRINFLMSA